MNKTALLLTACLFTALANAQTKKIAFRSHSGNMDFFFAAVEKGEGDTENSNFGVGITPEVRTAQLDSVILLNDSTAVMVTSEYCKPRSNRENARSGLWHAGKDTVFHHPVFCNYLTVDSIKKIIRTQYYFQNPVEKIVFVGFDRWITMNTRRGEVTVVPAAKNNDRGDASFLIAGCIIGISLLGGLLCWKFYRPSLNLAMSNE